jgi:hypothetical protein
MNLKLVVPPVVKTQTLFEREYAKQTLWKKLFCQLRKLVALTNPVVVQEVGNCTIESAEDLELGEEFDYQFGDRLFKGICPFMQVNRGGLRYRCTVRSIITSTVKT